MKTFIKTLAFILPLLLITVSYGQGSESAKLLAGGGNFGACSCGPDGSFVFSRFDFEKGGEMLSIINAAGNVSELFSGSEPAFRNGILVFIGNKEGEDGIWLYDFAKKTKRRLTYSPADHGPIMTPDGKRVIFSSFRDGEFGLFALDVKSANVVSLHIADATQPDISPDGGKITFVRKQQIWLLSLNTGEQRQISSGKDDFAPAFLSDDKHIVYVEQSIQPLANVVLLDLKTGTKKPLTSGGTEARSPRFSQDKGGIIIYVGIGPRQSGGGGQDGNGLWLLHM